VKFKDSELIGVPTIVVVGRGLADGTIEIKDRRDRRCWGAPRGRQLTARERVARPGSGGHRVAR
jgi:prolyl-tRNA synthetase